MKTYKELLKEAKNLEGTVTEIKNVPSFSWVQPYFKNGKLSPSEYQIGIVPKEEIIEATNVLTLGERKYNPNQRVLVLTINPRYVEIDYHYKKSISEKGRYYL